MKVILENELEKWAWEIMMGAHYKWEKNHGGTLRDQMDWYIEQLYKDERLEMINKVIEHRLREKYNGYYGFTEEEYLAKELTDLEDMDEDKRKEWENDFREDYKYIQESIEEDRDFLKETVEDELRKFYYTFFNAPEKLIVIYNG